MTVPLLLALVALLLCPLALLFAHSVRHHVKRFRIRRSLLRAEHSGLSQLRAALLDTDPEQHQRQQQQRQGAEEQQRP